jgi:hypothetical protein
MLNGMVAGEQFPNRCDMVGLTEDIPESAHQPLDRPFMNLRIDAFTSLVDR